MFSSPVLATYLGTYPVNVILTLSSGLIVTPESIITRKFTESSERVSVQVIASS